MTTNQEAYRSTEELIDTGYTVWNEGDMALIDEIYTEDCRYYDPFGEQYDRESMKSYAEMLRSAFPDFHVEEVLTVIDGENAMSQYTFSGTMSGEYRGFAPTGKTFELHGINSFRFRDGKIIEQWNATNSMAMAQQLGLLG